MIISNDNNSSLSNVQINQLEIDFDEIPDN